MDEILKKLISEKIITEDTSSEIKKYFEVSLKDAKVKQEKKIRAELSEQYDVDTERMHLALEKFVEQELKEHVIDLQKGVESFDKLKLEYSTKLATVKEAAQKEVKARINALEKTMETLLKEHIGELHENEVHTRRAYLNAINNKTAQLEAERNKFRDKAGAVLENIVNVMVPKQLDELREDIQAAKEADFGREIFESFMTTFRRQFFNSSEEFRALSETVSTTQADMAKLKKAAIKAVKEAKEEAFAAKKAHTILKENVVRKEKIEKLLSGLKGESKVKMKALLESAKSSDLDKTFNKFLPDVVEKKPVIKETVNRSTIVEFASGLLTEDEAEDDDIVELVRRSNIGKR